MNKADLTCSLRAVFHECAEKDFFIQCIGYDDFRFLRPLKVPRIQHIYTLHIIFRGAGNLILDGKTYRVKKQDMFFIPPGVSLCYYPDQGEEWSYLWFEFVGKHSEMYASKMGLGRNTPLKECKDYRHISYELQTMLKKLEREGMLEYYEVLSAFYRLMASNIKEESATAKKPEEIAISYIHRHYHDSTLTMEQLCKDLRLSHSHFCKIFKEYSGISAMHYLVQYRIEKAMELLQTTELSVKEISYSVGFRDCLHFMKVFKKQMGISAGDYRRMAKQSSEKSHESAEKLSEG